MADKFIFVYLMFFRVNMWKGNYCCSIKLEIIINIKADELLLRIF